MSIGNKYILMLGLIYKIEILKIKKDCTCVVMQMITIQGDDISHKGKRERHV